MGFVEDGGLFGRHPTWFRALEINPPKARLVQVVGGTVIARHPRSDERDALIFEPRHYLALLERKTGALDQAAPLAGWELPEAFGRLRRLLEARLGKAGTREYVQVLRLLEDFRLAHVSGAVRDALALGVATRRASSVESARRTASIGFLDSTRSNNASAIRPCTCRGLPGSKRWFQCRCRPERMPSR